MAGRKIVYKPMNLEGSTLVDRAAGVSQTLNTALATLSEQIQKLSLKSRATTFTHEESKILGTYIKALVDLSKEERERDKTDKELEKLKDLTDAELLELAQKHLESASTEISSDDTK